jgi:hypothetical protein
MYPYKAKIAKLTLGFILLPLALSACDDDGGDGNAQRRVTGTCAAGSFITSINSDGSVQCSTPDSGDITSVSAGGGLTGGGTSGAVALSTDPAVLQLRVAGACGGNTFTTAINADGTMACAPGGDITSVLAGSGLVGGGTSGDISVSLANGGVATAHLADGAVTMAKTALPSGNASGRRPNFEIFVFPATLTHSETAGSCLVTASAIQYGSSALPGFSVRPIITNAANEEFRISEWGYSHAFQADNLRSDPQASNGFVVGLEATATASLNVTGAGPWNLGCQIEGGSNAASLWCRVSYLCT